MSQNCSSLFYSTSFLERNQATQDAAGDIAANFSTAFFTDTGEFTEPFSGQTTNFFTNRSVGIGTNNPLFNLDVVGGFADVAIVPAFLGH